MAANEHEEGGSMKKKVATGVAVGLASTAAAVGAKKLMSNGDEDGGQAEEGQGGRGGQSATSGRARSAARTGRSRARSAASTGRSKARSTGSRRRSSSGTRGTTKARAKTKSATSRSRSSATRRASTGGGGGPTREQLYSQAKRLGIEGRSKMTKSQLQRAVSRARP